MENTLIPFIPSNLAPLLQIDLLILEQTRKKNAAQHRSGLFFRRVHEIYRLGKEIYRELEYTSTWTAEERERRKGETFRLQHEIQEKGHEMIQQDAEEDAGRHIYRLTTLLERVSPASVTRVVQLSSQTILYRTTWQMFPALSKASEYVPSDLIRSCTI